MAEVKLLPFERKGGLFLIPYLMILGLHSINKMQSKLNEII